VSDNSDVSHLRCDDICLVIRVAQSTGETMERDDLDKYYKGSVSPMVAQDRLICIQHAETFPNQ